ncbi:MAG: GDP-mannose 4,6-dehydratase [Lachnospiraceae bacterium]|jgi:GDP-4-dehydro-6-deoxy-D-mannose reductase
MKKVLIFGIGGFVGRYLSEEFKKNGYEVAGSDVRRTDSIPEYVSFTASDLLDTDAVRTLVANVSPDMIVNLAAISSVGLSWKIPQTTVSVNVVGALNVLEAAKALEKRPKVMFIGSSEEYEAQDGPMNEQTPLDANNPYGISKVTQERFARLYRSQYGMKVYCVRPFNHTGVGQRDSFVLPSFCKQAAGIQKSGAPGVIHVGNLAAKRDFSDVRDIVRAYRMIIESDDCDTIYNVGSGSAYGLDELLKYIVSLSTQPIQIQVDADRVRPIDTPVICCDHSLITQRLGWKPEHTIFETLKNMYDSFLANG